MGYYMYYKEKTKDYVRERSLKGLFQHMKLVMLSMLYPERNSHRDEY